MSDASPQDLHPVEEPRRVLYQPLSLLFGAAVAGITADRFLDPSFLFWGVAFCVSIIGVFVFGRLKHGTVDVFATILLLFATVSLFGLWHHDRWNHFAENDLGRFADQNPKPVALEARVVEMPRIQSLASAYPVRGDKSQDRTLLTVRAEKLRDHAAWVDVSGRVALIIPGNRDDLRIGDSVRIFGSLSRPVSARNPGDYDAAERLRSRRILSIVSAASPDSVEILKQGKPNLSRLLEFFRRQARSNLERTMADKTLPYAKAMLLGMREDVDEETTQSLMETGTMHILAISGLHIGLLVASIGLALRCFGVSRRTSALLLVAVALAYLFLTDVRPPAVRATVLICVVSVAIYTGRRSYGVNTLCACALIVLAINPTELFQFGAQLSFIATGAFFWIPAPESFRALLSRMSNRTDHEMDATTIERLGHRRWMFVVIFKKCARTAVTLLLVSLIIWLVSLPLLLERIHLFTPVALLVNPLLWLPLSAALLSGFAAMLLGWVPLLGDLLGWCADLSFRMLFDMIEYFRRLGGHYWVPGPPAWWNLGFYSVFAATTFLPFRRPSRKFLALLLVCWICVGLFVAVFSLIERRWSDRLTLSVFSVGHGTCVLITTPKNKTIVYDVGCLASPRRAADVMSRGLWRRGKTKIDVVVLSHADFDHYSGLAILAERFHIGAVLVSPYMFVKNEPSLLQLHQTLKEKNIPIIEVGESDSLEKYGLPDSMIFHPPKRDFDESDSSNATSIVLRFEHRGIGVLLPGDLEGRRTPAFLERKGIPTRIVMLPHHGGRSKWMPELLQWSSPELLLISAGRFTHRYETLADLRCQGYRVLSTYEQGYVELSIDKTAGLKSGLSP